MSRYQVCLDIHPITKAFKALKLKLKDSVSQAKGVVKIQKVDEFQRRTALAVAIKHMPKNPILCFKVKALGRKC